MTMTSLTLDVVRKASDVKGEYKPTDEDRKNLAPLPGHFKLSGDGVFHTIQGEGNWIGRPCTFIRLHFCNLHCTWCDAFYTWDARTEMYYKEPTNCALDDLHGRIRQAQLEKGVKDDYHIWQLVFTGGEPMLQQKLIAEFKFKYPQYIIQIETNGTIMPLPVLTDKNVKYNCSPKLPSSGNKKSMAYKPQVLEALCDTFEPCFKFVFSTPEDIDEVLREYSFIPRHMIYMMPEGVTKEENQEKYFRCANRILEAGLSTTPRLQNIMFDWAKRGV